MTLQVDLEQAADLLKQGQVIAYPTEAVWGLGCDPYDSKAFEQILQLKQRPIEKGVILIAASMQQAMPFLQGLNAAQLTQLEQSWQPDQRATTWLVPLTDAVPQWISGQHDKVAIRVTHHPLCKALCNAFGAALVSTSANPAGLAPALTIEQVAHYFPKLTSLIGQLGQSSSPSRIIDSITGRIIRD